MTKEELGLTDKDLKEITGILARFPQIKEALIFGSRALGNYKKGSDIDLVLKGEAENIYLEVKSLLNEETLLPYFFDVLAYNNVKNKSLKDQINKYGKPIYFRN